MLAPNLAPRTKLTGARVLAEIGDDRTHFADALALKAYAGSCPSPAPLARAGWSTEPFSLRQEGPPRSSATSPIRLEKGMEVWTYGD
ncbi:hypothetical protein DKM19_48125 [Streptosporangium sp. 'caverna']|nr:hypothetical protein DKM19_48125 [Streptosporangium sp. 'caverna']